MFTHTRQTLRKVQTLVVAVLTCCFVAVLTQSVAVATAVVAVLVVAVQWVAGAQP